MNKYLVGGIVIETSIVLPELVSTDAVGSDVLLEYGKVPEEIDNVTERRALFTCNAHGEVLFLMPNIARYLVEGNNKITIELIDETRKSDAEKYILTFILGVISFKKEFFPLHGGGVIHNGEAYLFTGGSGAGKSTTMAGLSQRGFQPIGDDIANIFVSEEKQIMVHPCFPRFKLWEDSLEMLEEKGKNEYRLRTDMKKYLVPMEEFPSEPIPVKRIYLLVEDQSNEFKFQEIFGKEKLLKLRSNSYKPWMVKAFKLTQKHFGLMNDITSKVEFIEFRRTKDKNNLDAMYQQLISHIKGE